MSERTIDQRLPLEKRLGNEFCKSTWQLGFDTKYQLFTQRKEESTHVTMTCGNMENLLSMVLAKLTREMAFHMRKRIKQNIRSLWQLFKFLILRALQVYYENHVQFP
jgi:hypothetical protein